MKAIKPGMHAELGEGEALLPVATGTVSLLDRPGREIYNVKQETCT